MITADISITDRPMRVLCLGAHSDDIEIGAGATLLKWGASPEGLDLSWVVFSAVGVRAEEAREGARRFGCARGPSLHEIPDSRFPLHLDQLKDLFVGLGSALEPDVILTHSEHDRHQDHAVINRLTWQTFRDHLILEYETPKFDGDLVTPNVYVTVDHETAQAKATGLAQSFASQRGKPWFSEDTFTGLMRIRGIECRASTGFAEGFHVRKLVLR